MTFKGDKGTMGAWVAVAVSTAAYAAIRAILVIIL